MSEYRLVSGIATLVGSGVYGYFLLRFRQLPPAWARMVGWLAILFLVINFLIMSFYPR